MGYEHYCAMLRESAIIIVGQLFIIEPQLFERMLAVKNGTRGRLSNVDLMGLWYVNYVQ